jgi:uncharacterized membrane protein AbrB (regulator of aidB expression)
LTALAWIFFVFILVAGSWQAASWVVSACQWFFGRSAHADRESSCTSSLPGQGGHDGPQASQPHRYATSHGRHLSSPPPAGSSADLESAAFLLPLSIGAIDPSPDLAAFGAGVELIVFVVLFTISSFVVLSWVLKTMRSSK